MEISITILQSTFQIGAIFKQSFVDSMYEHTHGDYANDLHFFYLSHFDFYVVLQLQCYDTFYWSKKKYAIEKSELIA